MPKLATDFQLRGVKGRGVPMPKCATDFHLRGGVPKAYSLLVGDGSAG
jgi:hypothetical protein